jgi:membrane protease YdiL (CAAX protease family)
MIRLVRSIGPRAETALVVLVAFGLFIMASLRSILFGHSGAVISNNGLLATMIYEIVALALIAGLLRLRGWKLEDIGVTPITPQLTLIGIGLFFLIYMVYAVAAVVAIGLAPGAFSPEAYHKLISPDLELPIVLLMSTINPIFEEAILCGYLLSGRRTGPNAWPAVHLSIAVRLLYHLYQGAYGVVAVVAVGFIFSAWYAKSRAIWPPILAHALFDLIGLMRYVAQ